MANNNLYSPDIFGEWYDKYLGQPSVNFLASLLGTDANADEQGRTPQGSYVKPQLQAPVEKMYTPIEQPQNALARILAPQPESYYQTISPTLKQESINKESQRLATDTVFGNLLRQQEQQPYSTVSEIDKILAPTPVQESTPVETKVPEPITSPTPIVSTTTKPVVSPTKTIGLEPETKAATKEITGFGKDQINQLPEDKKKTIKGISSKDVGDINEDKANILIPVGGKNVRLLDLIAQYANPTQTGGDEERILSEMARGQKGSPIGEGIASALISLVPTIGAGIIGGPQAGAETAPLAVQASKDFQATMEKATERQKDAMKLLIEKAKTKRLERSDQAKNLMDIYRLLNEIEKNKIAQKLDVAKYQTDVDKENMKLQLDIQKHNLDLRKTTQDMMKHNSSLMNDFRKIGLDYDAKMKQIKANLKSKEMELKNSPDKIKNQISINKEYNDSPITKNTIAISNMKDVFDSALKLRVSGKTGALADKTMVIAYLKTLEPTNAVMLGESGNILSTNPLTGSIANIVELLNRGGALTPENIQMMKDFMENKYSKQMDQQKHTYLGYRDLLGKYGAGLTEDQINAALPSTAYGNIDISRWDPEEYKKSQIPPRPPGKSDNEQILEYMRNNRETSYSKAMENLALEKMKQVTEGNIKFQQEQTMNPISRDEFIRQGVSNIKNPQNFIDQLLKDRNNQTSTMR